MIDVVFAAIRTKLVASSAVTSLLSSANAVYQLEAAESATMPYVMMVWSAGGDTNDTQHDSLDVRVTLRAVAENPDVAGSIAAAIYSALHRQELTYSDGWKHVQSQHTNAIAYPERVDRKTFFHKGGIYRIRASKR